MNFKITPTKFYNVLFPFWMLLIFPPLWLVVLPGNFLVDSLVLVVSMLIFKVEEKKEFYKRSILKIFSFGLLADGLGSLYMIGLMVLFKVGNMGDELYLTIPALIISALFIFIFNYFVTFKRQQKAQRFSFSLIFAIVTAPYTFSIPSSWLYG